MTDLTLSPELRKTAATARLLQAKSQFSKSAVSVLKAEPGSAEQANRCLLELIAARAEVAGLDQALERTCESLTPGVTTHE